MLFLSPAGILLALALAGLSGIVHMKLKSTYAKYSQVPARSGMTGAQVAMAIMRREGIDDVEIEPVRGQMTDHYDPLSKTVRLSEGVYNSRSLAAQAIAAHEVGHVIQHARGYAPLALRTYVAPVAQFGTNLGPLLVIGGLMFQFQPLAAIGVWLFLAAFLFTLITLPVEFNASSRAMVQLADGRVMSEDELPGGKSVLNAAALTYVAAAIAAFANFAYLALMVFGGSRE